MHKDPHQASASFPQSSVPRPRTSAEKRPRVLALSSSGGHWIQMLRLRPAFEGCQVTYVTTYADYECDVEGERFRSIVDANRTQKCKLLISALSILWVILTERPDVILSTGAAPGFFAIRIGKLLGKRTIWLDSIANAEELSLSGQKAGKYADLWLTQWEHLAKPEGPCYFGKVLGETGDQRPEGERRTSDLRPQTSEQKPFSVFATVGSDVPFDRMVKVIDDWAGPHPEVEVFAQIGNSNHKFQNIDTCPFLSPAEFTAKLESASLVIAHAGMGSILSALESEKPILVMPRKSDFGEIQNDHQLATVRFLFNLELFQAVLDERELKTVLNDLSFKKKYRPISHRADKKLLKKIQLVFVTHP